jgi:tetratricopeptide (TPR) repeat protein
MKKFSVVVLIITWSLFFLRNGYCDFSQEAREYRAKGYQAQQSGDLESALVFYQKACVLDPKYAYPHNDLGVIFEMKGLIDKAEQEYKKAISIDPNFASAHMNLALLYERMNKIDEAVPHWIKRVVLGDSDDPWTKKAWDKLWKYAPKQAKELEAKILAEEIARKLEKEKEVKRIEAEKHYQKGAYLYEKGLYKEAREELRTALNLLPDEKRYQDMYKMADEKLRLEEIKTHFQDGINFYQEKEYVKAKQEFEKIIELVPRPE